MVLEARGILSRVKMAVKDFVESVNSFLSHCIVLSRSQ